MQDDLIIGKLLRDLVSATSNTLVDSDIERQFSNTIGNLFGLEKVVINSAYSEDSKPNELYGYIINTKKVYVDNQLSEYSSFPELIGYKNRGFRSCAIVPIIVSGKVVSIVELLSTNDNKFSDELINSASLGAYFTSLALLYKYENERNLKLASYFNGAFNIDIAQILVSHDGKIIKVNEKAKKEIFTINNSNSTISELIGLDFAKIDNLSKSNAGSTVVIEKDRKNRLFKINATKINDRLMSVSLQDVTELYQLSKVIESMDESSNAGVIYFDNDFIVTKATKSIKSAIGFNENLILGKTLIELAVERQRGELKELLDSLQSKDKVKGSIDFASESGLPARLNFTLLKLGNNYAMLFTKAEAEGYLQSVRNAFNDFINNTSDIVITMDTLGYIKACNMPVENVLGYSRSELVGKELKDLYLTQDQAVLDRDITYVRNGGKIDNSYVALAARSGQRIDATHSIRLFTDSESADYIIVIKELETKHLINDLKLNLDKEKGRVSKLNSTGKLKSQFIYNISHELKTPLTNIIGFSKLLYSGEFGPLNQDQLNYIGTIIEEANRFMFIIQQVLDAAKLESEKMVLELREVDMKELYNNSTIQSLREAATKEGLRFSWNVDYDVPKINADQNKLVQVFVNLIGNAIKFTDKGEIKIKISKKGKTEIQCDVIDTGIGISEEDVHKLFKKFYEAPKKGLVKQEGAGTGLGLTITKEIIKLHGGNIFCESELNKGSKFSFTLKIKPNPKKKD
ncbi:MAG: ATP-binding protein [Candidatus Micrarchaeaceae archaeon]